MDKLQNIELEGKVLGACLVDVAYLRLARSEGVTATTFTDTWNSVIFATMCELDAQNVPIGVESLAVRLPDLQGHMVNLLDASPSNVMFDDWVACLRRLEAARNASDSVAKLQGDMLERPLDVKEHGETLRRIAEDYSSAIQTKDVRNGCEVGASWLAEVSNPERRKNIPILRGADLPFKPGWLFVIGADTGGGKTALAAGAVNCMIDSDYTVLYVCSETRAEDIYFRLAAARCNVADAKFTEGKATKNEWQALTSAHADLQARGRQFWFHCLGDNAEMKPYGIIASCDNVRRKVGRLDVIVVDFLQGLSPDTEKRNDTQTNSIRRILEAVENYATRNQIAVLLLSQYSRDARNKLHEASKPQGTNNNDACTPQKEWLRDSGSIEELAFVVAHLVRIGTGKAERCYLWCPKNSKHRTCSPFKYELRWAGGSYEAISDNDAQIGDGDIP